MDVFSRSLETMAFLAGDPVGRVPLGSTPHEVVFRQNKASLLYFAPREPRTLPLFVSMPLINTWTIFDLIPGHSLVEALLLAGIPLYVLDWGRPGPEDARLPLSHAVDSVLPRSMDRARRHAGSDVGALGYCVGGTFLAMALARHGGARRAAFLCTPIDFHASGRLARWADPERFPLDTVADAGNFPAWRMRASFQLLKPMMQSRKWMGLWERIERPGYRELWAALERWSADSVDFPAEAYREYVRACYFENRLITGGSLAEARMPAHVFSATDDHIVPPAAAEALAGVWGGPVEVTRLNGGHVGVCLGPALPAALASWARA